ncbi:hypothetical protein L7F22_015407 [Adiantum nelumboides]|nr:hypothetical protein [Adiantum nelumboides]
MGFMSRKVLPACGSLCVFCPALRSRSRQPVKRYKKLIADILQEELPNDRKISKLCDYASKNPLRLPEIAMMLEQRGYKAIRHGQRGVITAVVAVYIKLFSACKVQMPLFAVSSLNIIRALLDENQQDEMRVFGCTLLFEFAHNQQVDGTYIYQLDALLLKLCFLSKEFGEERRQRQLRAAGLRALSALIWFMGEHLHMPSEYNHVVAVIMDNYGHSFVNTDDSTGAVEIPSVWAQLCIEKIAQFCKEATTTRGYLEPLFFHFDLGKHWSPKQGLALTVLQQILHFVETFGMLRKSFNGWNSVSLLRFFTVIFYVIEGPFVTGNDSFILVVLVKHLDHKSVSQDLQVKSDIVSIAASLARQSKSKSTAIEIAILTDILRHLRNTLMATTEASLQPMLGDYTHLQLAIQNFLSEIVKKISNPAPIFETMALTLETLLPAAQFSQNTMSSLLILGSILAGQPLSVLSQQCFPEALLQQLALAMAHSDSGTRLEAHQVFETILSSLSVSQEGKDSSAGYDQRLMFKAGLASGLPSNLTHAEPGEVVDSNFNFPAKSASTSPCHQAPRSPQAFLHESAAIRLTEDQIGLLFSFLWRGLSLDNNMPRNYQANFRTATLMLQLSPARKSKDIFARVFQFSLSLRTMASRRDGHLSSARKRSLLTLSSAMLTVASNFYNIAGMEDAMKALREPSQMDPFLTFLEGELKIRDGVDPSHYGTPADNAAASKFLDQISKDIEYSNELLVSLVLSSSSTIFELDPVRLRDELLQPFSPTYCGFSLDLDANSSRTQPWIAVLHKSSSFDEAISSQDDCTNDNAFADLPEILISNPVCKPSASVMGVTQLLKSALEMAGQVAKIKAAAAPLSFSAVAMKCEDFGSSGRRKMPIWTNIDEYTQTLPLMASQHHIELIQAKGWSGQKDCEGVEFCSLPKPDHHKSCQTLQLPPVSHYDNFLRAAGC